jgi:hypothetical protein
MMSSLCKRLRLALAICGTTLLAYCSLPHNEFGFMEIIVNKVGAPNHAGRIFVTALTADGRYVHKESSGSARVFWSASTINLIKETAFARIESEGCATITIPVDFKRRYVPPMPVHVSTGFYRFTANLTVTLACQ